MSEPTNGPAGGDASGDAIPSVLLGGVLVPAPEAMAAILREERDAGPPWGLLDLSDGLWLGESKGPALFDDWGLAEVAAMVADTRLDRPLGITRPAHFPGGPVTIRDSKDAACTAEEALAYIESGLRFGLPPRDPPVLPEGNVEPPAPVEGPEDMP